MGKAEESEHRASAFKAWLGAMALFVFAAVPIILYAGGDRLFADVEPDWGFAACAAFFALGGLNIVIQLLRRALWSKTTRWRLFELDSAVQNLGAIISLYAGFAGALYFGAQLSRDSVFVGVAEPSVRQVLVFGLDQMARGAALDVMEGMGFHIGSLEHDTKNILASLAVVVFRTLFGAVALGAAYVVVRRLLDRRGRAA